MFCFAHFRRKMLVVCAVIFIYSELGYIISTEALFILLKPSGLIGQGYQWIFVLSIHGLRGPGLLSNLYIFPFSSPFSCLLFPLCFILVLVSSLEGRAILHKPLSACLYRIMVNWRPSTSFCRAWNPVFLERGILTVEEN